MEVGDVFEKPGISYGLAFPYQFSYLPWSTPHQFVVFRKSTGVVVAVFGCGREMKPTELCTVCYQAASKKCLEMNGNPAVDVAAIDSTP